MKSARVLASLVTSLVFIASAGYGCFGGAAPTAAPASAPPASPKGCAALGAATPPFAPGGYYTSGGTVCTAEGIPHLFHGVDRPSLEWTPLGEFVSDDDFKRMAGWGANVVRIALNQDFWLSGAALYDPGYARTVEDAVAAAEKAGLDVILDLHWSDCGDLTVTTSKKQACGESEQQVMADVNSVEFWKEVAATFENDGRVLFELYNEPHNIGWSEWLNGGFVGGYTAVGMQQLYDAVRETGANNVVIAGGISWAYDLSNVRAEGSFVRGYNVMYATHPYLTSGDIPSTWEPSFGRLATSDFAPVIVTEFGDSRTMQCTGDWDQALIKFADAHNASWTAWAWFVHDPSDVGGCRFPSLILDWYGTPTVQGGVVESFLGAYPKPVAPAALDDAGAGDALAREESADDASDGGSMEAADAGPE